MNNLSSYRDDPRERDRITRFFGLVPEKGATALDIGTRDGHLAHILATRFDRVVALDLTLPEIDHPRIECVKGDATQLPYADASFDVVICAEVLEHIPPSLLPAAGREIARVTKRAAVIGVPNRQDLRLHCTTCRSCGKVNPPWGHVNSLSESRLCDLLPGLKPMEVDFVGQTNAATNAFSTMLMNYAGNPFGTYEQEEGCVHCGAALLPPAERSATQRVASRIAHWCNETQKAITAPRGNWLHMRFER